MEIKENIVSWFSDARLTSSGYQPVLVAATSIDGVIFRSQSVVLAKHQIIPTIYRLTKEINSYLTTRVTYEA